MSSREPPLPLADPPAGSEPGRRTGEGADSLWEHLARDSQRKAPAGGSRPPGKAAAEAAGEPGAPRDTYTVLVVDDSDGARYALARGLRAQGFRTVEAAVAAEALKLAEFVSAVVLDMHLPDLPGVEVCRLLRARPKTAALPVIHVSAVYVEERDRSEAEDAGADDYFVTPVDSGRLAERLAQLLSDRRGHDGSGAQA